MSQVVIPSVCLPAMRKSDVSKVSRLEEQMREMEQVSIHTTHHFHAGMYSRTIRIPAGVAITGALIRIPTLLIVSGHATIFTGEEPLTVIGYHVITGSAGRKQVFVAHDDTDLTMVFPTNAQTVEYAEAEFTDETFLLMSRDSENETIIFTGDRSCLDIPQQ